MGLRCLIGHDYGDPQTSRDQRERGNEVVVTVTEYRECDRCGHRRVISENKEVKAGPPAEPAPEPDEASSWSEESYAPDDAGGGPDPSVDAPTVAGGPSGPAGTHEELTAEEDDGVILEDEPEQPPRAHGEWPDDAPGDAGKPSPASAPDEADPSDADHAPWPDQAGADEGYDAEAGADAGDPGVEFGGSLTPEKLDQTPDEGDAPEASSGAEIIDAESSAGGAPPAGGGPSADGGDGPSAADRREKFAGTPQSRPDNRDTEFVCPECGETWPTRAASLRPGDICPECHKGYLAEQVAQ